MWVRDDQASAWIVGWECITCFILQGHGCVNHVLISTRLRPPLAKEF